MTGPGQPNLKNLGPRPKVKSMRAWLDHDTFKIPTSPRERDFLRRYYTDYFESYEGPYFETSADSRSGWQHPLFRHRTFTYQEYLCAMSGVYFDNGTGTKKAWQTVDDAHVLAGDRRARLVIALMSLSDARNAADPSLKETWGWVPHVPDKNQSMRDSGLSSGDPDTTTTSSAENEE